MTRKIRFLNPLGILLIFMSAFFCDAGMISFGQATGMVLCGMLCMGAVWAWEHIFLPAARRKKRKLLSVRRRTIVYKSASSARRRAA